MLGPHEPDVLPASLDGLRLSLLVHEIELLHFLEVDIVDWINPDATVIGILFEDLVPDNISSF